MRARGSPGGPAALQGLSGLDLAASGLPSLTAVTAAYVRRRKRLARGQAFRAAAGAPRGAPGATGGGDGGGGGGGGANGGGGGGGGGGARRTPHPLWASGAFLAFLFFKNAVIAQGVASRSNRGSASSPFAALVGALPPFLCSASRLLLDEGLSGVGTGGLEPDDDNNDGGGGGGDDDDDDDDGDDGKDDGFGDSDDDDDGKDGKDDGFGDSDDDDDGGDSDDDGGGVFAVIFDVGGVLTPSPFPGMAAWEAARGLPRGFATAALGTPHPFSPASSSPFSSSSSCFSSSRSSSRSSSSSSSSSSSLSPSPSPPPSLDSVFARLERGEAAPDDPAVLAALAATFNGPAARARFFRLRRGGNAFAAAAAAAGAPELPSASAASGAAAAAAAPKGAGAALKGAGAALKGAGAGPEGAAAAAVAAAVAASEEAEEAEEAAVAAAVRRAGVDAAAVGLLLRGLAGATAAPVEAMTRVVHEAAAAGIRVAALTNDMRPPAFSSSSSSSLSPSGLSAGALFPWLAALPFRGVVRSSVLGRRKPEPEAFAAALRTVGLAPSLSPLPAAHPTSPPAAASAGPRPASSTIAPVPPSLPTEQPVGSSSGDGPQAPCGRKPRKLRKARSKRRVVFVDDLAPNLAAAAALGLEPFQALLPPGEPAAHAAVANALRRALGLPVLGPPAATYAAGSRL